MLKTEAFNLTKTLEKIFLKKDEMCELIIKAKSLLKALTQSSLQPELLSCGFVGFYGVTKKGDILGSIVFDTKGESDYSLTCSVSGQYFDMEPQTGVVYATSDLKGAYTSSAYLNVTLRTKYGKVSKRYYITQIKENGEVVYK